MTYKFRDLGRRFSYAMLCFVVRWWKSVNVFFLCICACKYIAVRGWGPILGRVIVCIALVHPSIVLHGRKSFSRHPLDSGLWED